MKENSPTFLVDFNELLDCDLVLLSASDAKRTSDGTLVVLCEGLEIAVYMEDVDENGEPDRLVARGRVERNMSVDWSAHVKWCCRIDENGIRHQSEL
jgi:hypothetical protein